MQTDQVGLFIKFLKVVETLQEKGFIVKRIDQLFHDLQHLQVFLFLYLLKQLLQIIDDHLLVDLFLVDFFGKKGVETLHFFLFIRNNAVNTEKLVVLVRNLFQFQDQLLDFCFHIFENVKNHIISIVILQSVDQILHNLDEKHHLVSLQIDLPNQLLVF